MRLVSTLKMVNLSSDPSVFEDGEVYFNTNNKAVRMSYSGSWVNMIDSDNLEIAAARRVAELSEEDGGIFVGFSYLILQSDQNAILMAYSDESETVNFIVPNESTSSIEIGSTIKIVRQGPGEVELVPESGVDILAPASPFLTATGTSIELIKYRENDWFIVGEFPDIY